MNCTNKKLNKIICIIIGILFISYSILMLYEVFIGPYRSYSGTRRYNLIPLKTISSYFINVAHFSTETIFINLFANIITFMPLGFFLPFLFKNINSIKKVLMYCIVIILIIEVMQFALNVGVMDIDDLILNTIGSVFGFGAYSAAILIWTRINKLHKFKK